MPVPARDRRRIDNRCDGRRPRSPADADIALARPARRDRHGLEQLPARDRPAGRRPLPAHRLPEGNRAPRRRARRRRPASATRRRRAASTAWRRFAQRARGLRRRARCARSRRRRCAKRATAMPSWRARRPALGLPIEVISGREEARLIYAGVARLQPSTVPRLVDRHRRALDRDDPRPRRAAAPRRVVPGRQRQPVDEVLRRRPLHRARVPRRADRRRRRARGGARARSRRATGRRRSARRARSARSRRCSPPAA